MSGVKLRYCSSYFNQPSCVTVIPLLFKQKITEWQFACIEMQLKIKSSKTYHYVILSMFVLYSLLFVGSVYRQSLIILYYQRE